MEKVIYEWGFRFIKLDYLYCGMLHGKFKNKGAAFEWYDRALTVLTSIKLNKNDKPVIYSAAACPFEATFKHISLVQISCNSYKYWDNKIQKN